jgi:EAL domain-containing protein (putative c-di-GMP-specific phosphodiesterase class I)/GGDEF domain-containing protein/CheY-like chemotaxis protein
VPIVYLSAEHDPDKQLDALSAGGEDFLTKPIRPKHLMATVRNRIDRSRRLRARAGAAVAAAHQDSNPALARKHVLETMEKIHASPAYAAKANAIVYLEIDTPLLLLEEAKLSGIEQVMSGIAEISKKSLLPGDRISRFGDFCLIITAQRENPTAIKEFARGIKQTVDPTYFPIDPNPINTSISIGARLIGANDQDASRLIDDALRACHKARSLGDDIIITPPPAKTPAAAISADEREDDLLTRVMHADNLQILYQPVVPLQKDNEALYQCLLRLRAGNGGLLCAGDFLPTIEQTGKILKLDRWVMLKAIVTLRKAQKNEQRQLRLFVSQAESALKDNSRIQWLQLNLSKSKVDGAGLVLEFRFPEITADLGRAREYIAGIRKLGVRVSLNSIRELDGLLRNLHHLPADYIKITEHQIRNYPDTWGELVAAAHELGKRIIVARIEHPELLGQLWANQVDYLQGNFIQQPEEELSYDFTGAILG